MIKRYLDLFIGLVKLVFAYILYPFSILFFKKKYDVIGTRNGNPGYDNGEFFFEYLNRSGKDAYIIYRYGSPYIDENKILKKNSVVSILYILFANRIFVTHSESDLIDYWWRFVFFKKVIFIQHGVIGIKALPEYERKTFYRYLASSKFEAEVFLKNFGVPEDKILMCGLPRFDQYSGSNNDNNNKCLIMFTWRKYLNAESSSVRLSELIIQLRKINSELEIYVNKHDMDAQTSCDSIEGIHLLEPSELHKAIATCGILFTDYSSVAWDFLYQRKKICFYPYDFEIYKEKEGLYCDFDKFYGYKINSLSDIDDSFFEKLQEANSSNNERFLSIYPFYYHFEHKHSTMLDTKTDTK